MQQQTSVAIIQCYKLTRWYNCVHETSVQIAACLHRIGRQDFATCPHWNGAEVISEHLVLHCPCLSQILPSARPGAAGVVAQPPLPKWSMMSVELPGEDRGGDLSPWPGMRERESGFSLHATEISVNFRFFVTISVSVCDCCPGRQSNVFKWECRVQDHAFTRRWLCTCYFRRRHWLLGRRYQQVSVDGSDCWGWTSKGH